MRPPLPKALFAITITAIGVSLLYGSSQEAHGSSCPTQDCESCAFCALATPACVSPCPQGCARQDQSVDHGAVPTLASDGVETAEVAGTGAVLDQKQLTCPVAVDLITEAEALAR